MLAALSLAFLSLFGLGYLIFRPLKNGRDGFKAAGLSFSAGLLANSLLAILSRKLALTFAIGSALSVAGLLLAARDLWPLRRSIRPAALMGAAVAGAVLTAFGLQIFSAPIDPWDARFIWFFHSKMIWIARSIGPEAGWSDPSIQWSHPDYPKMAALVGAQLAAMRGFWNEFVPRGNLLILLAPPLFWILSFRRVSFAFLLLFSVSLLALHYRFWNGYMDAPLALYGGIALLLGGRYWVERDPVDLYGALLALGMTTTLKNEGMLLSLCIASGFLTLGVFHRNQLGEWLRLLPRNAPRIVMAIAVAVLPTLAWTTQKLLTGVKNDLGVGSSSAFQNILGRLTDGHSPLFVIHAMVFKGGGWTWKPVLLFLLAGVVLRRWRIEMKALPMLMAAMLYFTALCLIYLSTPHDLGWHVSLSVDRTMLPFGMCVWIAVYFRLAEIEENRST